MTALLNFVPIALAIICYVLAGVFKADPGTHDGLLVLAGSLAGWSIPRLGDMFGRSAPKDSTEADTKPNVVKLPPPPVVALLVLGAALLSSSCSWWQKNEPRFQCAGLATVEHGPELVNIVIQCAAIAASPAAAWPCVQAAAASKWPAEVLACFYDASQGRVQCPAFSAARAQLAGQGVR